MKGLFVTGIGTGVGKTIVSAILTKIFKANYWKPVQSGDLHFTDTTFVKFLVDKPQVIYFNERYKFKLAASPQESSALENVKIDLLDFTLPATNKTLIVEGAGGLMVPLNNKQLMIDLIACLNLPAVLVVKDYLGCINHTILSIEALQKRNIAIEYVVLNGSFSKATEDFIIAYINSTVKIIRIPNFKILNSAEINKCISTIQI